METYQLALRRLVNDGHILKERGGETGDKCYELVHDQFGEPLKKWAQDFSNTPKANLGGCLDYRQNISFAWRLKRLSCKRRILKIQLG